MTLRLGFLLLSLAVAAAFAGDGIPPRGSAADYSAHATSGKLAIGAAYVTPAQARKLFGEDLDKHGFAVFEIGVYPADATQADVSADDFKLRQGKESSVVRAATPHGVTPGNVTVYHSETIGYQTGPYGHGVYTASGVGVGVGKDPQAPPPPAGPPAASQAELQQRIEDMSLPEGKTTKAVAGYVFFPKPSNDKRAEFELLYFGIDGQVSLKLSPTVKP